MCDPTTRETSLTNIILKLLKDANKWVKISAYKQLGPFISTLSGFKISDKLYDNYIQMTGNTLSNISPDNEVKEKIIKKKYI